MKIFKKSLVLLLILSIVGTFFSLKQVNETYADGSVFTECTPRGDGSFYCGIENNDPGGFNFFSNSETTERTTLINSAFDFSIGDAFLLSTVPGVFRFLAASHTFIVIKNYEDGSPPEVFFNVPNLSQLMKNLVLKGLDDGYTYNTYKVKETEWLVPVIDTENTSNSNNAMEKFGFSIPSYYYRGEYPIVEISFHHLLPQSMIEVAWRGISSFIFGSSFLKAPDSAAYNSMIYYNHTYDTDQNAVIIEYLKEYWQTDFIEHIISGDDKVNPCAEDEQGNHYCGIYWPNEESYPDFNGADSRYFYALSDAKAKNAKEQISQEKDGHRTNSRMKDNPELNNHNRYDIKDPSGSNLGVTAYSELNIPVKHKTFKNGGELIKLMKSYTTYNNAAKKIVEVEDDYKYIQEKIAEYEAKIAEWEEAVANAWDVILEPYNSSGYEITSGLIMQLQEKRDAYVESLGEKPPTYEEYLQEEEPEEYEKMQAILKERENAIKQAKEYIEFMAKWEAMIPDKDAKDKGVIKWSQCLVTTTEEDYQYIEEHNKELTDAFKTAEDFKNNSCYVNRYEETTPARLSMVEVIAQTGLWKVTAYDNDLDPTNQHISTEQAWKILQTIQKKTGPYYKEVMRNIITLMRTHGGAPKLEDPKNVRTMPYLKSTIIEKDQESISVSDPRAERAWQIPVLSFTFDSLFGMFNITNTVFIGPFINLVGRLAEITVWLNKLVSFDILDSYGLSPATMWSNSLIKVIIAMIFSLFIIRTAWLAWKAFKGERAVMEAIKGLIVTIFTVGIFTLIQINPQGTWNQFKTTLNKMSTFGEQAIVNSVGVYDSLMGNGSDGTVAYWIPYFELWSYYNTGYSLTEEAAIIRFDASRTEYKGDNYNDHIPTIGGRKTNLWPIVLADAFSYNQDTEYQIKDSAYRVVDHYMAPELTVSGGPENQSISVRQNKYYNGNFQNSFAVFSGIGTILIIILLLITTVVKLLTFIWWWWQWYLLIFNVMLSFGLEYKDLKDTIKNLIIPAVQLFFVGLWSGMVVWVNSLTISNAMGQVIIALVLYFIGVMLFRLWYERYTTTFPHTLRPLYAIINILMDFIRNKSNKNNHSSDQSGGHAHAH